ncbi:hypothetical protein ACJ6WD_35575 [Streptomyces sp. VTCC 41912]|uniref:hypothetical protein n=1 Tax=Streptomyces sp. VTCC 41912 TaxID=3383243 RepID=UPI0038969CE6
MPRFLYRCPVCCTTSPLCPTAKAADAEGSTHRGQLHAGHHPDGETVGEVNRRGQWYATLGPLAGPRSRLADALIDARDPDGMGRPFWADVAADAILAGGSAAALWVTSTVLTALPGLT